MTNKHDLAWLALFLGLSGCGVGDRTNDGDMKGADLANAPPDLAMAAGDLAMAAGDLAMAAGDLAGGGGPSQTPPMGQAALEAWLARSDYKRWHCEAAPHAARPPGAHGENRICSNDLLSGSAGPGDYPIGSASVKELYSNGQLRGYAVGLRTSAGAGGNHWYWYERSGGTIYADGTGVGLCTGCHNGAPRDQVFTQVR